MDLDDIKRGLRSEIKRRENEQYATFQCNVRQMCKDVLAKLEEQESVLAEKDKEIRRLKRALWLARAWRAKERQRMLPNNKEFYSWQEVERRCSKKAEEY